MGGNPEKRPYLPSTVGRANDLLLRETDNLGRGKKEDGVMLNLLAGRKKKKKRNVINLCSQGRPGLDA